MERYHNPEKQTIESRTDKHRELYEDFYTKTVYKEINNLADAIQPDNAIDLGEVHKIKRTREDYHKAKDMEDIMENPLEAKKEDLSIFFQEEKPKIYDINSVLEEAKKNHYQKDEMEKRRKLANDNYNILMHIPKDNGEDPTKTQEEALKELINTITSSSLKEEIDEANRDDEDSLLSDLMPTRLNETLISEELSKAILDEESEKTDSFVHEEEKEVDDEEAEEEGGIDRTFYTRSMDLSDQDFDEELKENEFEEESHPFITFLKVLLAIALVVGIAILVFYLMSRI